MASFDAYATEKAAALKYKEMFGEYPPSWALKAAADLGYVSEYNATVTSALATNQLPDWRKLVSIWRELSCQPR